MEDIYILGIESSCDETAVSVVKNGRIVLSNVINTQIPIHTVYGGVVPEIASRNHIDNISDVTKKAVQDAKYKHKSNKCSSLHIWARLSWSFTCGTFLW